MAFPPGKTKVGGKKIPQEVLKLGEHLLANGGGKILVVKLTSLWEDEDEISPRKIFGEKNFKIWHASF